MKWASLLRVFAKPQPPQPAPAPQADPPLVFHIEPHDVHAHNYVIRFTHPHTNERLTISEAYIAGRDPTSNCLLPMLFPEIADAEAWLHATRPTLGMIIAHHEGAKRDVERANERLRNVIRQRNVRRTVVLEPEEL